MFAFFPNLNCQPLLVLPCFQKKGKYKKLLSNMFYVLFSYKVSPKLSLAGGTLKPIAKI